jgi:hypothetical protein
LTFIEFRQILKAKLQQNKPKPPIPRRNDGKISNAYYHANIQCVKKINTSFCPSSITVPVTVNLTESHINKLHSAGFSHV